MTELRLIESPSVYLVSRTETPRSPLAGNPVILEDFIDKECPGYKIQAPSDAEGLCEVAGRLCYMSFKTPRPGGNAAYLGHILESGHGSILEHAVFGFIFTGVSRSLTHELVRHRAGFAYSQLSQRYVDESDCAFVVPPELRLEVHCALYRRGSAFTEAKASERWPDAHALPFSRFQDCANAGEAWLRQNEAALHRYTELTTHLAENLTATDRRKAARQAARSVLPNCTETKIFVTGNARAWRHFIEMRASRHADAEIRALALEVCHVLQSESPNLFGDYDTSSGEAVTPWRKV